MYTLMARRMILESGTSNSIGNALGAKIGTRFDLYTHMNGSIDQVHIWNRSLSASEISMLYNTGVGMYNRTHSDATSKGMYGMLLSRLLIYTKTGLRLQATM